MDSLIGIKGKDFVMIAADAYATKSIFKLKNDEDKLLEVDSDKILGLAGPIGDRLQFGEYLRKNIHLERLRTGIPLSVHAAAQYARNEAATNLRSNPHHVDMLVAGHDSDGPKLFWLDYLASLAEVGHGAQGYAAYFVSGLLDGYWKKDLTEAECLEILQKCRDELQKRFLVAQTEFFVKVVDANGIRRIEL